MLFSVQNQSSSKQLYMTYVLPVLEYASQMWSPQVQYQTDLFKCNSDCTLLDDLIGDIDFNFHRTNTFMRQKNHSPNIFYLSIN